MIFDRIKTGWENLKKTLTNDPILSMTLMIITGIILVFIIYPLFRVVHESLVPNGNFTLSEYITILTDPRLREALTNSLLLGTIVATSATIVGFIAAFSLTKVTLPGSFLFRKLVMLPLISPPFMLSISVIFLLGRRGLFTFHLLELPRGLDIYGLPGLAMVQTLGLTPIAYRTITGVLSRISSDLENAGLNLGASRFEVFKTITLPLSLPGLASAWLLSFVLSVADFANPMVLGEEFNVLSVEAYIQITGRGNFPRGAAFAVMLLLPALFAFLMQRFWVSKRSYVTVTGKPTGSKRDLARGPVKKILFLFMTLFSAAVIILYGTVISGAFVETWAIDWTFTLEHFEYALQGATATIYRTIFLSTASAPISALLGMIIAFIVVRKDILAEKAMHFSAILPFAVPGTVIGIGYVLAFNDGWIVLTGTSFIIIFLLSIRNMPVGLESGVSTLKQIDTSISEASKDLGANTAQTFKDITMPLLKPAILTGVSYGFVRAMTAVSAIIFVVSARWNHLTVRILQHTEYMELGAASVLCLFLILFVMAVFSFLQWLLGEEGSDSDSIIT